MILVGQPLLALELSKPRASGDDPIANPVSRGTA